MRLPPLPKLRVRRPNQTDANPCLALMSSVLSMLPPPHLHPLSTSLEYQDLRADDGKNSLLGIIWVHRSRMPGSGDVIEDLYGYTSTLFPRLYSHPAISTGNDIKAVVDLYQDCH